VPPEAHRFKPGQSGNPGGRPKDKPVTDALRRLIVRRVPNDAEHRTYAEVLAQALVHAALKGKTEAAREVLDRVEGRLPHSVAAIVDSAQESLAEEPVLSRAKEILERARKRVSAADQKEEEATERIRDLPEPENTEE
jgi:hypothetical protein